MKKNKKNIKTELEESRAKFVDDLITMNQMVNLCLQVESTIGVEEFLKDASCQNLMNAMEDFMIKHKTY